MSENRIEILQKMLREFGKERQEHLRAASDIFFQMKSINAMLKKAKGPARFSIEVSHAIARCGGADVVARACNVKSANVSTWRNNGLPETEWSGETRYAEIICMLDRALSKSELSPIELCPGARQYMSAPDSEAA